MTEVTIKFRQHFHSNLQLDVKVFDFDNKAKGYREGYKIFHKARESNPDMVLEQVSVRIIEEDE